MELGGDGGELADRELDLAPKATGHSLLREPEDGGDANLGDATSRHLGPDVPRHTLSVCVHDLKVYTFRV